MYRIFELPISKCQGRAREEITIITSDQFLLNNIFYNKLIQSHITLIYVEVFYNDKLLCLKLHRFQFE